MKSANMLKKNKDFAYCYRRGKRIHTDIFTMYFVNSRYNKRAGFSVSKKVGKAVVRNKIRRRMKEGFTVLLPTVKENCSVIFVARPNITDSSYQHICKAMESALRKAKLT